MPSLLSLTGETTIASNATHREVTNMGENSYRPIRHLRIKKGQDLKAFYAKRRRAFTAADLQQYTEMEEGIPAEKVLAELEALAKQPRRKPRKG
jgi:hypothetical protein